MIIGYNISSFGIFWQAMPKSISFTAKDNFPDIRSTITSTISPFFNFPLWSLYLIVDRHFKTILDSPQSKDQQSL